LNASILLDLEQEEKPRQDRIPVDVVAPGQENLHAWLIRWGRWQNTRPASHTLASVEGLYNKVGTPPSTAPMASDPTLMAIEVAVVGMLTPHRDTLQMFYIKRFTPYTICRAIKPRPGLRYESWAAWIFSCRSSVHQRAYDLGYCL
jgi:hypothetical protein